MSLNIPAIGKTLCSILVILGVAMLLPLLASLYYGERDVALIFVKVLLPLVLVGGAGCWLIHPRQSSLRARDGLLTVALVWIAASLLGSLPYWLTGSVDSLADAIFESTASFTTTGASVMPDVESAPRGVLLWRALVQWLGGMGILIFAISILPALGIGGQKMARAETPSPIIDKLTPRMSDSARILYLIYISFTVILMLLLLAGGLDVFDALSVALASVASGGFHIHQESLGYYNSFYVELLVSVFTVLVCVNFNLYYKLARGRIKEFFADRELLVFLALLLGGGLLISADLFFSDTAASAGDAFRLGFFQSVSAGTTAGHTTADVTLWPRFSQLVLILLMLTGACGSSTGSGIKVVRVIVLFKLIHKGVSARLHPRAVVPIKIHGRPIAEETVTGMVSYFGLYTFIFAFSLLVVSLQNLDLNTTFSAVLACLNNTGLGLGLVGPTGSFHVFSDPIKLYLSFLMIVGRLELFTILMLFMPGFWNPDR